MFSYLNAIQICLDFKLLDQLLLSYNADRQTDDQHRHTEMSTSCIYLDLSISLEHVLTKGQSEWSTFERSQVPQTR